MQAFLGNDLRRSLRRADPNQVVGGSLDKSLSALSPDGLLAFKNVGRPKEGEDLLPSEIFVTPVKKPTASNKQNLSLDELLMLDQNNEPVLTWFRFLQF